MPVPTSISELSTTAGSNSPASNESVITTDDYIRAHAAFIAQLEANKLESSDVSAFGATLIDDADEEAAQTTLGGTTVGKALFTAADEAAARTAIEVVSGTYTPTVTASTGVSSIGTIYDHFYTRVGNLVTIQGRFICTISSTANTTVVVTLPIASNFTNADTDMLGIGHVIGTGVSGTLICVATAATDDFRVLMSPDGTGSCNVHYTGTYIVK